MDYSEAWELPDNRCKLEKASWHFKYSFNVIEDIIWLGHCVTHVFQQVPLTKLPGALAWFTESLLPDIAFPFLAKAFKNSFYADVPFKSEEDGVSTVAAPSSGEQKLGLSLRIVDAFVVKVIQQLDAVKVLESMYDST